MYKEAIAFHKFMFFVISALIVAFYISEAYNGNKEKPAVKDAFEKRFCVEMLDSERVRNYSCIKEGNNFGCSPKKETIDEVIFELCEYEGE